MDGFVIVSIVAVTVGAAGFKEGISRRFEVGVVGFFGQS